MRRRLRSHSSLGSVLAIVVLVANIGAPFSTCDNGRVFVESLGRNLAHRSLARVVVATQGGSPVGFRAVVGLDSGRIGEVPESSSVPPPSTLSPPTKHASTGLVDFAVARPTPPLRC
jgi:hypothetical protein